MKTEPILKDHNKSLDHLLCDDIWHFLKHTDDLPIEVESEQDNEK